MDDFQAVEKRGSDREHRALLERPADADPFAQGLSRNEFHHHVGGAVRLEEAQDSDDIRMAERGERARFVEKPRKAPLERLRAGLGLRLDRLVLAALREVAGQVLLDRDLEVEVRVGREISQAEAPDPESLLDAVFVQLVTAWQGDLVGHRNAATPKPRPSRGVCAGNSAWCTRRTAAVNARESQSRVPWRHGPGASRFRRRRTLRRARTECTPDGRGGCLH